MSSAAFPALILALALGASCDCGGGVGRIERDGGVIERHCASDLDCELGWHCADTVCVEGAAPIDSGFICTDDDQCPKGEQCVRSTGQCVVVPTPDAGEVDSGIPPACQPGLALSCGQAKLGECRLGTTTCESDGGSWAFGPCAGSIGPTAEVCDGKDNDCDGLTDEGLPDLSCGVGACARTVPSCAGGQANTCTPGAPAPETCDGLDNNCDGNVDEGLVPLTCGVGVCARSVQACMLGAPQVCTPGGTSGELCNGFDDDCNGQVDDGLGTLSCGVGLCARTVAACLGGQPQSCVVGTPGTEVCNGVDDNCDGFIDEGQGTLACGVGECARTAQRCVSGTLQVCTPGLPTAELCNGLDDDCDGTLDDGLGAISCGVGVCAVTVQACVGGAPQTCTPGNSGAEVCDGLDNDCDGQLDENMPTDTCGLGICRRTVNTCVAGVPQTCVPGTAGTEICDASGQDENCDGQIDEGCSCVNGATRPCYGGPAGTQGVGTCLAGSQTCVTGAWGACAGQVLPAAETCNGFDDNCDSQTDEGFGTISCGVGQCARTVNACLGGVTQSCVAGTPGTEACNGQDDDCDGQVDELLGTLSCGVGQCARTVAACVGGLTQSCLPGSSATEVCDGVDNDCDGQTDEGLGTLSCGTGACSRIVAACVGGVAQTCVAGTPSTEVCNGADDDCDTQIDEGFGSATCGQGVCVRTVNTCVAGVPQTCTPGTPTLESCNGLDDDCDGFVDDGTCGPASTCPADRTENPNTIVTLTTNASSPVGRPFTCAWSVVSRPATANGTFSAPTSCASSTYFADVVGTHVLRFTVTDSAGLTSSCTVSITVVPLGDLWIELTWDRSNDMDLHLLHPSGGSSHAAASWQHATLDCDFANKTPEWDVPGIADNPSLDRDDGVTGVSENPGMGPENTRINVPSTAHPYTIGVHMYSWAAATTVNTTLRVYCAGQLKATLTRPFSTNKQMWVAGTVDFAGAAGQGCFFTPDGYTLQVVP